MRIAYISYEFPPDTAKGGIGTYTWQMALAMAKLNHVIEVFTASHRREISEQIQDILVHRVNIDNQDMFSKSIVKLFAKQHELNNFDILECAENGADAWFIKQAYPQITLVVRLHAPAVLITKMQNFYIPLSTKIRFVAGALLRGHIDLGFWAKHDKNQNKDPEYQIVREAKFITAPSEAMKKWATDFWKIPAKNIFVVPNPYEPSSDFLDIPLQTETKIITFLGRLNVIKGCVALTFALKKVFKKHSNWKIRFIAKNEAAPVENMDMKTWILQQLTDFQNNVEFIEWIEYHKIPHYFSQSDICIFPSLFESFSYVCAEAMSAGRAIIGSSNGGMAELLNFGETGILVKPQSVNQIYKALCKLIENKELRLQLGHKARERIIAKFNAETISKQMNKIYKQFSNS